MKRLLSLLLTFCLTASLLPAQVQAAEIASGSGLDTLGIRQISEKEYAMTPDVKEYEWILNNGALTQQMMGHVMEVKVGEGSTASIATGYSDDDIDTIKTCRNWAMTETTKQAQSMQTRRKTNVVGAINAGGYDMSNGRPSGAFIMSGTQINPRPARPSGSTRAAMRTSPARRSATPPMRQAMFWKRSPALAISLWTAMPAAILTILPVPPAQPSASRLTARW